MVLFSESKAGDWMEDVTVYKSNQINAVMVRLYRIACKDTEDVTEEDECFLTEFAKTMQKTDYINLENND